jgi:cyclopropane fatty-acyl-phospholipid synthase-like methyltransferase
VTAQKSLLFLFASLVLWSITATAREPDDDRVDRGTSDPYTGDLSIFEEKGRGKNLQIDRVMDLLGIKAGTHVADIGAGSGWFTVRSARRIGKEGTVYAVEINRDYIRHIERRAKKEKLANIRTILGKADDPMLPPTSVDAVVLLKTYHEIEEPIRFMRRLRAALRPGALVGVIDRGGIGTDHGVNADVVIKEARQAGYELVEQHDFVKSEDVEYFLILR